MTNIQPNTLGAVEVQEEFFKNLKKFFPDGNYADQVADVLSVSRDPAYRRIRGWKEITLAEVYKLMRHCNAQMSELLPTKDPRLLPDQDIAIAALSIRRLAKPQPCALFKARNI
jgi:hypothetical protein